MQLNYFWNNTQGKILDAFAEGSQVGKSKRKGRLFTVPFEF